MKHIRNKFRVCLITVLATVGLVAFALGFAACNRAGNLKIDAPERIEEDLGTGTYVVPRFDVVNEHGVIMAGYSVRLKSATDPNGEEAEISREASTIVTLVGAGEYTFVYTADSKNVPERTVIMDFADRTAPTIKLSSSQFPTFFIQGVTYSIPEYTLEGDYVASKCYTKVFYSDENGEESEAELFDGSFTVKNGAQKYTILIHVEDAAGNDNDYRYSRSVHSPEHYEEDVVIYFNEKFGEKQVAADGNYSGKFVSVADGGKAYGGEAGSYKIEFDGSETENNEAYFALKVPAIANIMKYKELEMYVYIEDENCESGKSSWVVGSKWWNDTAVFVGKWTRVTWSVENWGDGKGANCGATTSNVISADNISGTRIRLIPDGDYSGKTPPHGTVYFSAVRAVPYQMSQVTADENVMLDKRDGNYRIGETVTMSAEQIEGKSFDCFLVNDKPIGGNTFVATKDSYHVKARYVDGALTLDNMTWGETDSYKTQGSDAKVFKLGSATHWVLTCQPEMEEKGWVYTSAYVGGADQLFGIEMHSDNDSRKLSGYGGAWKGDVAIPVSEQVRDLLRASKTAPVTMIYVRKGEMLSVYIRKDADIYVVGSVAFSVFEVSGDDFGIGERAGDIQNAALKNIRWIVGEERTNLYLDTLAVKLEKTNVDTDKDNYYLGETVKLSAKPAPDGQAFAYFTADGEKLEGNTLLLQKRSYKIAAVYTEITQLKLGAGIETADGNTTVGKGSKVTLVFNGKIPEGKYFKGFQVDGEEIEGNIFVTSASSHTVEAVFADRIEAGNKQLNNAGAVAGTDGIKTNPAHPEWLPSRAEYVSDRKYVGIDGDIKENGSLKLTLGGGEQGFALAGAPLVGKLAGYKSIYFYAYTEASGLKAGSWWCGDTPLVPGQWTKVSFSRVIEPQNVSEVSVWKADSIAEFIYRITGGAAGTEVFLTSVYGVPYARVNVAVEETVKEYIGVSSPANGEYYLEGETVTLTHDGAPEGKAFAYFTVNGERYDGNTYVLGTDKVVFGAVFNEISTLTLGDGVMTADGETQYGRGVQVSLLFDSQKLNGKVVDYYLLDKGTANETRIYNGVFTTSAESHTIEAVLVEPASMTWANGGKEYQYETVMGSDASEWKAREFDGEVYGSAEYWAVSVNVKHTNEWNSFEFIQGSKQSIRVRFHQAGYCGVVLMTSKSDETIPSADFTVAYPTLNSQVVNRFLAGATVTCVRSGATISLYIDGYLFFKTNYAVDHTGNWFGVGHVTANDATKPAMSATKFIVGKEKVEAYLTVLAQSDTAQQSRVQINSLKGAVLKDNSAAEYIVSGIPEGLVDENVKESGVLKLTSASSDVGIVPGWTFERDASAYEQIYFYVYIRSAEELAHVGAGAYWKDNTQITANTWVKVTLDSAMIAELADGANSDLSKITLRIYTQSWLEGHTSIEGKTIYVTSLYGVPKTVA